MRLRLKLVIIAAIILIVLLFTRRSEGLIDEKKLNNAVTKYKITDEEKRKLEQIGNKYGTIKNISTNAFLNEKDILENTKKKYGNEAMIELAKSIK